MHRQGVSYKLKVYKIMGKLQKCFKETLTTEKLKIYEFLKFKNTDK